MQGINNLDELKTATADIIEKIDINKKKRDFEHLLFNKTKSERILLVEDFFSGIIEDLIPKYESDAFNPS